MGGPIASLVRHLMTGQRGQWVIGLAIHPIASPSENLISTQARHLETGPTIKPLARPALQSVTGPTSPARHLESNLSNGPKIANLNNLLVIGSR